MTDPATSGTPAAPAADNPAPAAPAVPATPKRVVVIPVRDEIASPVLYILRRGLKEAIEEKADVVVLDMKTPGGALDVTFDMMEALAKFPGETLTFVNNEAMSAGASDRPSRLARMISCGNISRPPWFARRCRPRRQR